MTLTPPIAAADPPAAVDPFTAAAPATATGPATDALSPRRLLRIFGTDPVFGGAGANQLTLSLPNEPLQKGPCGSRVEVVDYDGSTDQRHPPVDLDHPSMLASAGLDPAVSDPRFHQQMVYAVATKVIENFDRALGYRFRFERGRRLRIFPHAYRGADACFDPQLHALLFGYFRTDVNGRAETVFTCLSPDIIAHETTRAIIHRLRPEFNEASNPDALAFHLGFADIVAMFQHFTYDETLADLIVRANIDPRLPSVLVELSRQFASATGHGRALRTPLEQASAGLYESAHEPCERGGILVAAVFDAFFRVYQRRIRDLVRIAGGGTALLFKGAIHPALAARVAAEAARTAQSVLTMCIRAFEYLPPVDVTFRDFLHALSTADFELDPADETGLRAALAEAFRVRGMDAASGESPIWPQVDQRLPRLPANLLSGPLMSRCMGISSEDETEDWHTLDEPLASGSATIGEQLHEYARANCGALHLDPTRPICVRGFHTSFRVDRYGRPVLDMVTRFTQRDDAHGLGGLPFRGGTTVISSLDGSVRYVISKPISGAGGKARLAAREAYARESARRELPQVHCDEKYRRARLQLASSLATVHP